MINSGHLLPSPGNPSPPRHRSPRAYIKLLTPSPSSPSYAPLPLSFVLVSTGPPTRSTRTWKRIPSLLFRSANPTLALPISSSQNGIAPLSLRPSLPWSRCFPSPAASHLVRAPTHHPQPPDALRPGETRPRAQPEEQPGTKLVNSDADKST